MAITSPALSVAVEALFGYVTPAVANLTRLGGTDFSAEAPAFEVKPGTTVKVPISSVTKADVYDEESNNYTTGGETSWASLTAAHYLKGFDISGVDIDRGVNAGRIKQLFSKRAGAGIALAIADALKVALDSVTASTGIKIAGTEKATMEDYINLGSNTAWLNKAQSALAVNGPEYARIRAQLAANHLSGTDAELASYIGFRDLVLVPGMTARALIVPQTCLVGYTRVPQVNCRFAEAGVETDEATDLSIGIVVADDQPRNRQIVNADLWAGVAVLSANAPATQAGIIKVGTVA